MSVCNDNRSEMDVDSGSSDTETKTPMSDIQRLHAKVDSELKERQRCTNQLQTSASQPDNAVDASRCLLLSNAKIMAHMREIRNYQVPSSLQPKTACSAEFGDVTVSGLRLPLMWKDSDHFKNKGDHRRYAVFCLLSIGSQVYSTNLLRDIDRKQTDISFDDVKFCDVPHDFQCSIEVYCHVFHDDMSIASASTKLKKRLSVLSGTLGRRLGNTIAGVNSMDLVGNKVLGPKFELIADGKVHSSTIHRDIATHDLCVLKQRPGVAVVPLYESYYCNFVYA